MSGKYPGGFVTAGAPAGFSVAFDGTGDYLSGIGTTSSFNFVHTSSALATLEAWVYRTVSAEQVIFDNCAGTASNRGFFFEINTSGNLVLQVARGATGSLVLNGTSTGTVPLNIWTHVAVTYDYSLASLNAKFYINGAASGTANKTANTPSASNATSALSIGALTNGTLPITGYVSNARITNSIVYSAAFNPPTQLFNESNTQLLTCNSPAVIDQSNNAFTITANGNAAPSTFTPFTGYTTGASGFRPALGAAAPGVWTLDEATTYQQNRQWPIYDPNFNQTTLMLHGNSPTNLPTWITDASGNNVALTVAGDAKASSQTPFSLTAYPTSGSGYFNGSTDYLTAPDITVGSGPFTFECWFYYTGTFASIAAFCGPGIVNNGSLSLYINNSTQLAIQRYGFTAALYTVPAIQVNTWNHVAFVRDSSTNMTVFLNGTRSSTGATTSTANFDFFRTIGYVNSTVLRYFSGYLSNLRCTFSAVYDPTQTTITVPTAPLTAVSNTQLLTLQNAQPTANSSFTDSSTNNFPITRFGNTTQGTFTPFSQTGWSGYITSPLSNYLYSPSNVPAFTGDFTIECWVRLNSIGSTAIISASSGATPPWDIYLNSSGTVVYYTGGAIRITTVGAVSLNQWTHIAVVRSSGVAKIYLNGIADVGTYSSSATIGTGSEFLYIGRDSGVSAGFDGYISNYRLAVGAAVYTSNFTPPTAPLGATTGGQNPPTGTQTYLLTCQSNRFVDNSGNSNTPIIVGSPQIQSFSPLPPLTAYTPYNVGGSGFMSASTDYLTTPCASNNSAFGTADFTVEVWIYPTASAAFVTPISSNYSNATAIGNWAFYFGVGSATTVYFNGGSANSGTNKASSTTTTIPLNAWTQVVYSRVSSVGRFFINGVQLGTTLTDANNYSSVAGTLYFGRMADGTNTLTGYVSDIRIIKGTGYTTYSLPTAPLTPITNTGVLLSFTNAGIIDSTADNVLQTLGNAQISAVQSKYGGRSMSFNGTNSYLKLPSNVQLAFGTGNFTIEFWAYFNVVNAAQTIIDFRPDNTNSSLSPYLELSSGGAIIYYLSGNTQITTSALSANTWYHIALVRSDGINNRIYVNGVQSGSTFSNSSSLLQSGVVIGFNRNNAGIAYQYLNGYIDDLRITNGIARYTAPFTPPTSQLQSQ